MNDNQTPLDQQTYRNIRVLVFMLTILGFICALILIGVLLST